MKMKKWELALLAALVLVVAATLMHASIGGWTPNHLPLSSSEHGRGGSCEGCNLVLIVIDTLRADHLGFLGYERDTSPVLDEFARESMVYTRFYAPIPETNPSIASIFTSKPPYLHGVRYNKQILSDEEVTLAEVLSEYGYECGAVTSAAHVSREFGLHQGFRFFDYPRIYRDYDRGERAQRKATQTVDIALKWLADNQENRFFLFVHLFDPHFPYEPPEEFQVFKNDSHKKRQRIIALYDGEIRYADNEIGRLLSYLRDEGLMEDTAVVVTADHGESLGEHDYRTHGDLLYEDQVWVPLIIHVDGLTQHSDRLSQNMQLKPTILEILGVSDEQDAYPSLYDDEQLDVLVFESDRCIKPELSGCHPNNSVQGKLIAARQGRHKYIFTPTREGSVEELYDVVADPGELLDQHRNISLTEPLEALRQRVRQLRPHIHNESSASVSVVDEAIDALRSLGYIV